MQLSILVHVILCTDTRAWRCYQDNLICFKSKTDKGKYFAWVTQSLRCALSLALSSTNDGNLLAISTSTPTHSPNWSHQLVSTKLCHQTPPPCYCWASAAMKINCRLSEFAAVLPQVSLVIYGRQTQAKSREESAAGSVNALLPLPLICWGLLRIALSFRWTAPSWLLIYVSAALCRPICLSGRLFLYT